MWVLVELDPYHLGHCTDLPSLLKIYNQIKHVTWSQALICLLSCQFMCWDLMILHNSSSLFAYYSSCFKNLHEGQLKPLETKSRYWWLSFICTLLSSDLGWFSKYTFDCNYNDCNKVTVRLEGWYCNPKLYELERISIRLEWAVFISYEVLYITVTYC